MNKTLIHSAVPSSATSVAASTKSQEETEAIRRQLLDAVSRDDVVGVQQACRRVTELGLTLTDTPLRDSTDHTTVLHTALMDNRWKVATHLIQSTTDDQLLDEVYDVTGQSALSSLTYQHQL